MYLSRSGGIIVGASVYGYWAFKLGGLTSPLLWAASVAGLVYFISMEGSQSRLKRDNPRPGSKGYGFLHLLSAVTAISTTPIWIAMCSHRTESATTLLVFIGAAQGFSASIVTKLIYGIGRSIDRYVSQSSLDNSQPNLDKLPSGLHVDWEKRHVYWNQRQIPFNTDTDFDLFSVVYHGAGVVVPYADLVRALKLDDTSESVEILKEAPEEVKQALHHIRRACREIGAPNVIEVVRRHGYRLSQKSRA